MAKKRAPSVVSRAVRRLVGPPPDRNGHQIAALERQVGELQTAIHGQQQVLGEILARLERPAPSEAVELAAEATGPDKGQARAQRKQLRRVAKDVGKQMDERRKSKEELHFRPDDDFFRVAKPVMEHGRTLLGYNRLYVLWQAVKNVYHLDLAMAEIGSFRGGSAYFLASAFQTLAGKEATMHVFDTFEGHPDDKITEQDSFHTAGMFSDTSYEEVKEYLSAFQKLEVHKGEFSASIADVADLRYGLVHIDTDLYEPTLDCLQYYAPRLPPGGIAVIDDYFSRKCPGVPEAVAEYLHGHGGFQAWDVQTEQLVLIKISTA